MPLSSLAGFVLFGGRGEIVLKCFGYLAAWRHLRWVPPCWIMCSSATRTKSHQNSRPPGCFVVGSFCHSLKTKLSSVECRMFHVLTRPLLHWEKKGKINLFFRCSYCITANIWDTHPDLAFTLKKNPQKNQKTLSCIILTSCIVSSSCSGRSLIYLFILDDDLSGSWKRGGEREKIEYTAKSPWWNHWWLHVRLDR